MSLTVSVVIPNYNYGRFLRDAIESVLSQTYKPLEIIVVDDGSTDESLKVLQSYEGNGVKVVRQENSGVGSARNRGTKESSGEVIAFLDADDIWLPDKLESQVEFFEKDPDLGLVSCGMQEFDPQGKIIGTHENDTEGLVPARIVTFEASIVASGSAIAVRRTAFDAVGGFDERKEMHPSEDWEFFYRISRVAKVSGVTRSLVKYRNHGDNGHLKIARFERAMMLAYETVFKTKDDRILRLRRKSYGNLFRILAGSYFRAKQYGRFFLCTLRCLLLTPENIIYFVLFPFRQLSRSRKN